VISTARPLLPRLLAGLDASGDPMTLADHERVHGPMPSIGAEELVDAVEHSGLRGRGGADFPTAVKLRSVAASRRRPTLIVNGSETEPASAKDRLLLSRLPHLVLDGAVLVASTIGAREVLVHLGERAITSHAGLAGALAVRDDRVPVGVVAGPEGYVTGEETAVIAHLNGSAPVPTFVPPRPYERGYRGRPTLVQNPETLAQIALVARRGPIWYRELGTEADPGSVLMTVSGAVREPGVYELAFGSSLASLLGAAGGPTEPLRALLIGGYFGTWVDAERITGIRLARRELQSVGCSLGAGVLIALGESACGLHESVRIFSYLAAASAGQCGPCVYGLEAISDELMRVADGAATRDSLERIRRWSGDVRGRGACHHPDGAVRFLDSALRVFAEEIADHHRSRCRAASASLPFGRATAGVRR
jgi:NADH:ubiquinone oxidoreductase subunit F (NADH-binding)